MTKSLEEIQEGLLDQVHRGERLDPEAVLALHPEHAQALREFLRVLDAIEQPPEREPMPARLGEFQIVRELGRGGMGIVYEAVQLSLKRPVALKILPPALGGHSALALRFRREAEAAARLRHPGVVAVHSCGEVGGTPFFAMELVEGITLAQTIAELRSGAAVGVPPEGESRHRWAVELAAKVADALAYAHAQGIVHRDVKPSNILLEQNGTPRLSDFGLALDLENEGLTLSGEVCGSPRYMSPEQAFRRQRPIDGRSDVYSLGVTLYELLTLRFPYDGATSSEYLMQLSEGRLVAPSSVDPSISPALERVLLKSLAREPDARYAGAAEFAADLRALPAAQAAGSHRPTPPAVDSRPPPRTAQVPREAAGRGPWPRRAAWFAAALLVVSAAVFACQMLLPNEPKQAEPAGSLVGQSSKQLSPAEIELLADGQHPRGSRRLASVVEARTSLRRVVALDSLGAYAVHLNLPLVENPPPDVSVLYQWTVGFPGEVPHFSTDFQEIPSLVVNTCAAHDLLAQGPALRLDASRPQAEHGAELTVVHSLHVRICRAGKNVGTLAHIELPPQSVEVRASYPDDYPESVRNDVVDSEMVHRLSAPLIFLRLDRSRPEGPGLVCRLGLPPPPRALAFAGRITLFLAGGGEPVVGGNLVLDAAEGSHPEGAHTLFLRFAPMTLDRERELLSQLESTPRGKLRLRLEADRGVALSQSSFDRVWGGSLDVEASYQWTAP